MKVVMDCLRRQSSSKSVGEFLKRNGQDVPRGLADRAKKLLVFVRSL